MGRNNTRAAKSIAKMYEQLGLPQDDIFHKTKLLLSIYRKKEAVMLLGIALWGYAIPAFRGIFDVEGDESEIPEFFANTEKSDLCPT